MKPITVGIIIAIVVVILIIVAGMLGFINLDLSFLASDTDNNAPTPNDLGLDDTTTEDEAEFDDFDIYGMLCILTDKTLDQDTTMEYIDRLNIEAFGSSISYVDIYGQYSLYYENKGWDIEVRTFPVDSAIIVYSKDNQGASVITSSRPAIQTMYGYNTMTLTSTGSIGTYTAFINFIQTS